MIGVAISIYAGALVAANLAIAHFGPWIAPLNAFVLIGLDLALRDWLHLRISRGSMLALIVATGALTYLLNPAAGQIAAASVLAFVGAAGADYAVFAITRGTWLRRSMLSNVAGAAVDSVLFSVLAGGFPVSIVAAQFAAKLAGGSLWSLALSGVRRA